MVEPGLGYIAEVLTTQEASTVNSLLDQGWELIAVAGPSEWPAYVVGRPRRIVKEVPNG